MKTTNKTMQLRGCAGLLAMWADETLTMHQIWKKAKKPCYFKYAQALIKKHNLPHKKETVELKGCAGFLAKVADETLTIKEIWEKVKWSCDFPYAKRLIEKHNLPHKKEMADPSKLNNFVRELEKYADKTLTIKEIWEKAGKHYSLSYVYIIMRLNKFPYKKDVCKKKRPIKYLDQIKCLQTKNLTIKEIMGLLGLSKNNDYFCIYNALVKNNLPFRLQYKRKDIKTINEINLYGEKK